MGRSMVYVGGALLFIGLLLFAAPTSSFSTIAGDRPVDVGVSNDQNALLALEGTSAEVHIPGKATAVGELINNFNSPVTVSYTATIQAPEVVVRQPSDTLTIRERGTARIFARCKKGAGGSGTTTLSVDVTTATANNVELTGATLETTVHYDCPGPPDDRGPPGGTGPPEGAGPPENAG